MKTLNMAPLGRGSAYLGALMLSVTLVAACSSPTSPEETNPEAVSTAPLLTFEAQAETGTTTLTRADDGVSYSLSAEGLTPGTANTLWMVIFNRPEYCSDAACGEDDLVNEAVRADVVFGGDGHVIDESGTATFTGSRTVGTGGGSIMATWLGLPEPGLIDAREAEIHFVIRNHGPVIPALAAAMTSTFNAGCGPNAMEGAPPVPESLGTHGPNTCTDDQFAVHQPLQ